MNDEQRGHLAHGHKICSDGSDSQTDANRRAAVGSGGASIVREYRSMTANSAVKRQVDPGSRLTASSGTTINGTALPGSCGRKPSGSPCSSGLWLAPAGRPKAIPWAKPIPQTPAAAAGSHVSTATAAAIRPAGGAAARAVSPMPARRRTPGRPSSPAARCSPAETSAARTSPTLTGERGWAYYSNRQYQAAMSDYDRAISINPGKPVISTIAA